MNVFTASGNVGKDAELRFTPAGKAISQFSLAVKSGYGEHEKTSWVMCKLFGKQAEAISQYITKGSKVTVTGEFTEEKWTAQDGSERSTNSILVRDIDLPPKPQSYQQSQPAAQQAPQQRQQAQHVPPAYQAPQQNLQQAVQQGMTKQPQMYQHTAGGEEWEDEIPFAPIGLQYGRSLIHAM